MNLVDLLLLTDGRAPIGAYAHSFGLEAAVSAGDVTDVPTLAAFVGARLATSGRVDAAFVATCCHRTRETWPEHADASVPAWLLELDTEYTARIAAPAIRDASRTLGRHLLRLARQVWPTPRLEAMAGTAGTGWHQPIVLGALAASRDLTNTDAALAAVFGLTSGLASAGVRLLGLDPIEVHAVQARLADDQHHHADEAAAATARPISQLPATATPLLDIRAHHHAADPAGRLFAS